MAFDFLDQRAIGIMAALLAARFVPESKAARARAFDPVGQALVLTGLATLTWGVIEGPHAGWGSGLILGLFVTAGLAFVAFVLYEPRRRDPLLDLRFFHSVPFSSATVLALSAFSCFAGFLFLNALYLQQVRGFSAFHTGLFTLPLAVAMIVCAPMVGTAGRELRNAAFSAGLGRGITREHADADRTEASRHRWAGCWQHTRCSVWGWGW
jgi:hypothetical protein